MFKDFRPALWFLGKFLGIYVLGNVLYGLYIASYKPRPDPVTRLVTIQSISCLNLTGVDASAEDHQSRPSIAITEDGKNVISVFEGCNGINVLIIFVAFVVAFGGSGKTMAWFIPVGIVLIHVVNLLRIGLLYYTARHYESWFYYVHKYFFTAILYVIVFLLWGLWVVKYNKVSVKPS